MGRRPTPLMMMLRRDGAPLFVLVALVFLLMPGCSNVSAVYQEIEGDVARGQYLPAIAKIRENRAIYGEKAKVLYHLDLGLLFHYAGLPDSSNTHLFAAEREMQELYTKSVSLAALSFLTNDNVLPYDGEDHEKVLVNLFLALNYAELGNTEDALVEARKVDLKLRDLSRQYEGKNAYQEDAFVRYIAGVLYENDGASNDAFISYRKAYETYQRYQADYKTPLPPFLLDDLVRTATRTGLSEEAEQYRALGGMPPDSADRHKGTILVVAYAGRGPIKQEQRPSVTIADTGGTLHTFQVALPKFVPRLPGPRTYDLQVMPAADSARVIRGETVLGEDITAIAEKCLDDRIALVYLKSGGRALLKFLAAEKAKSELKKKDDKLINFLGSLAIDLTVGATEQADVRAWGTLPGQIQIARLRVPPGHYALRVRARDGGLEIPGEQVDVRAGKATFVIVDDIR